MLSGAQTTFIRSIRTHPNPLFVLGCGTQFELKNLKAYSTSELVPQVHCLALEEIFPSKEVLHPE